MLFSEAEMRGHWPWPDLEANAYDLIMIDAPWHFETRSEKGEEKSPQAYYDTMTLEQIAALPVAGLAAKDCLLWMWATAPLLDVQIDILKGWGFRYVTTGAWVKTTKSGKLSYGLGYFHRNSHELWLIGARGACERVTNVRSVIMAEAREHSRKPDEAFAAAELMRPSLAAPRRVELFSRQRRRGWDCWGNEVGKFE